MIHKIILKDFQSHWNTELDLSPGINIITGTSNSGKTAIIRGLKWLITNRPLGDSIVRRGCTHDKKNCTEISVQLVQEGNPILRRWRRKSENGYSYQIEGQEIEEFKAFGSTVPQEILDLLNFSEINVQYQHDSYFLVFDSPGQVASYINKVTKLDEVDNIVSELSSQIRSSEKDIRRNQEELDEVVEQISLFDSLFDQESFLKILQEAEKIDKEILDLCSKEKELYSLVEGLKDIESSKISISPEMLDLLDEVQNSFIEYVDISELHGTLNSIISKYSQLDDIKVSQEIKDLLKDLQEEIKEYIGLEDISQGISNIQESLSRADYLIECCQESKEKYEKEMQELYAQLDTCPACGEKLTKEGKDRLLGDIV